VTQTSLPRGRRATLPFLASAALLLTACGSQLSEQEIALRTAGTGISVSGAGPAGVPGSEEGAAFDPAAAEDGGAGAGVLPDGTDPGAPSTGGEPGGEAGGEPGGDAGGEPGREPGREPGGETGGETGGEIVIGNVGSVSGIYGGPLAPVQQAVKIWAQAVNAKGGIGGRKVRVVSADDGGNAAKHQQLVQQMVDKDKVVAFVGQPNAVTMTSQTVEYLKGKGIPVVGGDMGNTLWRTSPLLFPQATSGGNYGASAVTMITKRNVAAGKKKIGIIACQEVAICSLAYDGFEATVRKAGGEPVYRVRASLTATSYTSECLGAQRAGAEVLYWAGDSNSWGRVARSCTSQGYRPVFANAGSSTVPAHAQDDNVQGGFTPLGVFPWFDTGAATPAQKEYLAAIARYLPGGKAAGGHAQGWASGKLFETAVLKIKGPVTSAAVVDALTTFKGETLGGLTPPLTFTKGKASPELLCASDIRIKDKKFVSPDGGKITCF
jgi:branched-chain amino acid transport system substrate-binding protein